MSCQIRTEEHTDHLLAYAAGKLRGDAAARLEAHMRSCEECAAIGLAQSRVWSMLDNWEVRPVSAEFNRQLYARIDAKASASWADRFASSVNEFMRPLFARPAFPLAAASLVIVAGFVLDHPGKLSSPNGKTALHASSSLSAVEMDQVESTLDDIELLRQFDPKQDDGKETSSKPM
jgi:anti-sigma factor RsiW